jgi:hypothetical protein
MNVMAAFCDEKIAFGDVIIASDMAVGVDMDTQRDTAIHSTDKLSFLGESFFLPRVYNRSTGRTFYVNTAQAASFTVLQQMDK